jgi:hypothetical protein
MVRRARSLKIILLVLASAAIGLTIFGALVWRSITVELVEGEEVTRRFSALRASLASTAPLVDIDDAGRVTRRTPPPDVAPHPIARLKALAWHASERRLVSADTPFWFFKLKGPAARYALNGTGFDLERLELTPSHLERFGPSIILDHTSRNGSRLLVWTE